MIVMIEKRKENEKTCGSFGGRARIVSSEDSPFLTKNWIWCEECEFPINTSKYNRDHQNLMYCPKCGLVVDENASLEKMCASTFSTWLKSNMPNLSYKDYNMIFEVREEFGNQKAMRLAVLLNKEKLKS